jgi:hypothetical protein
MNEATWATLALVSVTASFPFYLWGAKIVLDEEVVTWDVLTHHLRVIAVGLLLTTVPVVVWMVPRLLDSFTTVAAFHAFIGLQAYALLGFALSGIVRIFQVKRQHELYHDPDPEMDVGDLHENMDAWRGRLRAGVFGYVLLWLCAYVAGWYVYLIRHVL